MKSNKIYMVIDGEVRLVTIDASKDGTIEAYISSELVPNVKTLARFIELYGDTYYKSLLGYRRYKKFKVADLDDDI